MIRILSFYFFFFPLLCVAQSNSQLVSLYRTHSDLETGCLFMENDNRPLPAIEETTYSISITVTDIRNTDGVIRFKFYDKATPFPDDKGFLRIVAPKSQVVNGTFSATFHGFPSQEMGIALLDDENDNWKLDMGWFFPKEGHAFSNYYHSALRRPQYDDFKFVLTGDTKVVMKMRYY